MPRAPNSFTGRSGFLSPAHYGIPPGVSNQLHTFTHTQCHFSDSLGLTQYTVRSLQRCFRFCLYGRNQVFFDSEKWKRFVSHCHCLVRLNANFLSFLSLGCLRQETCFRLRVSPFFSLLSSSRHFQHI